MVPFLNLPSLWSILNWSNKESHVMKTFIKLMLIMFVLINLMGFIGNLATV